MLMDKLQMFLSYQLRTLTMDYTEKFHILLQIKILSRNVPYINPNTGFIKKSFVYSPKIESPRET